MLKNSPFLYLFQMQRVVDVTGVNSMLNFRWLRNWSQPIRFTDTVMLEISRGILIAAVSARDGGRYVCSGGRPHYVMSVMGDASKSNHYFKIKKHITDVEAFTHYTAGI